MPRLTSQNPHRGGQLGMMMLIGVLSMTSCVALAEQSEAASPSVLPAWFAVSRDGPPAEMPAQVITEEVQSHKATFIVKFEQDEVLSDIIRSFRRDRAGSRLKFKTWAETHEALAGLQLVRAGYSGDFVLALPGDSAASRTPGQIIADLNAMENCIYAELDEIAMPGKGED